MIFLLISMNISLSLAQDEPKFYIISGETGQYLVRGDSYLIDPMQVCGGYFEEIEVDEGKKYSIVHLFDEMMNSRAVIITDKAGNEIDYTLVQNERKKFYEYYICCIYVKEMKGKLYFWDIKEPYGSKRDFDCYYESQTDASNYLIPRYYIFDPKEGTVKTVILKNECFELFRNEKINCN